MSFTQILLLLHAASTLTMVGVIWTVQRVHYPLMIHVPAAKFPAFERAHQKRIGPVVMPLMLTELVTALALLATDVPRDLTIPGAIMLALIWLSTFFVQVPLHRRLENVRSPEAIARLVRSNWIRTALWSARGIVALLMLR